MHNYTREIFHTLSKKEKSSYIDRLIERGVDLSKEEISKASKKQIELYVIKKLSTRRNFEEFEIKYLNFDQVVRFMQRNNSMIDFLLLKYLTPKQRLSIIHQISGSKFHLNLDEFFKLKGSERKFYANSRLENDFILRTFEVKYLSLENQMKYVAVTVRGGSSLSQEMVDVLRSPVKKEYKKLVSDNLHESNIRRMINKRIRKTF